MMVHKCDLCGSTGNDVESSDGRKAHILIEAGSSGIFIDIKPRQYGRESVDLCNSCWEELLQRMYNYIRIKDTTGILNVQGLLPYKDTNNA